MTIARCEQLRAEVVLVLSIRRTAYRYFGHTENAKDAEAEAWARIIEAPDNLDQIDYLTIARRAISASYMRKWRKRKSGVNLFRPGNRKRIKAE